MSRLVGKRILASISLLEVFQGVGMPPRVLTFHELFTAVKAGTSKLVVCGYCGQLAANADVCCRFDGEISCPACGSLNVEPLDWSVFDMQVEWHHPWRLCEHCNYAFLWDDDIAQLIEPDESKVEPGSLGCPCCKKLTR